MLVGGLLAILVRAELATPAAVRGREHLQRPLQRPRSLMVFLFVVDLRRAGELRPALMISAPDVALPG